MQVRCMHTGCTLVVWGAGTSPSKSERLMEAPWGVMGTKTSDDVERAWRDPAPLLVPLDGALLLPSCPVKHPIQALVEKN